MKQTVYLDVLFFVNFTVDLLIFLSVGVIMQKKEKWYKYCFASIIGAIYSCLVFFMDISPLVTNLGAILLYCLVSLYIFKYKNKKLLFRGILVTLLCVAFYGGLIFMLYLFTGIGSVMTFNSGALYIDIPVFGMLIFCFIAYGVLWLVSRVLSSRAPKNFIIEILIELNGQQTRLRGFIDTGNKLSDPVSGLPVIITSLNSFRNILPKNLIEFFATQNTECINSIWKKRIRALPCSTVNGQNIIYAVKCDNVYIQDKNIGTCLVAIINKELTETKDYEALIPLELMNAGGSNNERITEKTLYPDMQAFNR